MRFRFTLVSFVMLASVASVFAQDNYSIPVDSWTYNVIQELQTRGYLLDLDPGFKPYHRIEVARALERLDKKTDITKLPQTDRWLIEKLDHEFSYELSLLKAKERKPDTTFTGGRLSEEVFANLARGDYETFKYAGKLEFRPVTRSEFGFDFGNHISIYTDVTGDQTLKDDTLYTGARKFGIDALDEQAYIRYSDRYVDFTLGRDYLSWGYGDQGSLFLSSTPGALDMASLFLKSSIVRVNWFLAQLNPMPEFTPDTNSYMPIQTIGVANPLANRYLTGTRFEFTIAKKIFVSGYEAALFGGPNAPVDFETASPLRFVEDKQDNSGKQLNAFVGVDFSVYWWKNYNFYGGMMIDDWSVDHKKKSDLKPNLYAIQLGARASNVLAKDGINGTDVSLQYMMAGNRVYNEYNWVSYQKLLLRNYPIANPFGDNFWNIDFRLSQWIAYDWKAGLEFMHLEHGNSNISSFYTMPWLTDPNVTVQTGYSEPFPYGIIQETNLLKLDAMYQPESYFYGSLSLIYAHDSNANYVSGSAEDQFSFLLTFYYDFSYSFLFK